MLIRLEGEVDPLSVTTKDWPGRKLDEGGKPKDESLEIRFQ